MPTVPATQEAEAGESLEPGRQRLQSAEIAPLHSSLVTEQDSVSKKQNEKKLHLILNNFYLNKKRLVKVILRSQVWWLIHVIPAL